MAFSHSHKTVFVMDRSPYFMESCRQPIDFEMFMKVKGPGMMPISSICKSLWTCNIEAVLEYIRIIYDLFPSNKLIQVIVSDMAEHIVSNWSEQQQNLQLMSTKLAELPQLMGGRTVVEECNLMRGITKAVEALSHSTDTQKELKNTGSKVINRGRIIVMSAFNGESAVNRLEERIQEVLAQCNQAAAAVTPAVPAAGAADTAADLMSIDHCDLVLIDIAAVGLPNNVKSRQKRMLSPILSSEVHVSPSGTFIAIQLVELAIKHYNLSSTTVTGIPMKEEQNASSSANYDVELLHPAEAHEELFKSGQHVGLMMPSKEGLYSPTVTLKWCTPKSTAVELHPCTSAYRVTPVDVISRPSSCLTNFLLNGRSVMLEQPRKNSGKLISHMLTSHAGEIYLHVLATSRSILEDPPSISEGVGGRLTDYRISDFGEFMKENKLIPLPVVNGSAVDESSAPVCRAKSRLERMTRMWPLTISDTILFNMSSTLEPLTSLIIKPQLNDAEVLECKKVIYHIVGMESRNEGLPTSAAALRNKGAMKRDEQYRQMWAEFEKYVRAYAQTPQHIKVLDCLLECRKPTSVSSSTSSSGSTTSDEVALPGRLSNTAESLVKQESSVYGSTSSDVFVKPGEFSIRGVKRELDGNTQCQPDYKKFRPSSGEQGQSILSMWTNRIAAKHKGICMEFSGRQTASGNKAELYQHLKEQHSGDQDGRLHNSSSNRNRTKEFN